MKSIFEDVNHAQKHADRLTTLDSEGVTARYSKKAKQLFAGLESSVQSDFQFDEILRSHLQTMASTQEINVKFLLPTLLMLGKEAAESTQRTGNIEAAKYLTKLIVELSGSKERCAFSLLKGRPTFEID